VRWLAGPRPAAAAASQNPILDALVRLDELGVELHGDGERCWPAVGWARLPPEVQDLIRQEGRLLAGLIGRTHPNHQENS
jgi:hypothetical protein